MPFMIPKFQHVNVQNNLAATPATSWATTVTGTTTSATGKGSWTQLISSTSYETNLLCIAWAGTSASGALNTDMTMDVGIGASGVENVLIPDLIVGWSNVTTNTGVGKKIYVPMYIPAGSRISARTKTSIANDTAEVAIWCYQGPSGLVSPLFNRCDVYGLTSGGPGGTEITSGNTGLEGSWTDVGSTTTREYGGAIMLVQGTNTSGGANQAYHFELGVGGITFAEYYIQQSALEATSIDGPLFPVLRNIPSGAQLQVRGECQSTAQVLDVAIYCFY